MSDRAQTFQEEVANSLTHGLGILFCVIAIPFMIISAAEKANTATVWSVSIFGFSMLMVYVFSTLYHAVQNKKIKYRLRIWDHISIFLLIGGSNTAVVTKFIEERTAWLYLVVMWSIILLGSILKLFFTGKYRILEFLIFFALGWMAMFVIKPLLNNAPQNVFMWIVIGGASYTFGTIFYLWKRLKFHHAVWHIFVLGGTVTHFVAVYNSIPINIL